MAHRVAQALADAHPLLCEAPTGTGKTLAYLVPAALHGGRVLISTGTRHLQEQILHKDLPLVRRALGRPIEAVVLKGIANYLCLRRLEDALGRAELAGEPLARIAAFRDRTATGDRAELFDLGDDDPLWERVSATSETRLGSRCPFHEACFVTQARRRADAAQIVIVNHHLLCADLAVRARFPEARLLPAYEALICDEAHGVEEVATQYFGLSVSAGRLRALCGDLQRAPGLLTVAEEAEAIAARLFRILRQRVALPDQERAGLHAEHLAGEPAELALRLDGVLYEAEQQCQGAADGPQRPGGAADGRRLARRARLFRDDLAAIVEGARTPGGRHVFWLEVQGERAALCGAPVTVAGILSERLYRECPAVVMTSATLAPLGRFDYTRERLGLADLDTVDELRLPSPFDLRRQALLYLPDDLPEPGEPAFLRQAARRMAQLIELFGGRAFLLFTSHRRMQGAHALLEPALSRRYQVLCQGQAPKQRLVERFIAAGGGAVLFATASFWEGVDVAGDALQLVVIDKIPFAPPDDPLLAARCRRLMEEGQDPFLTYQVPRAALLLKQGFGRLIRHRGDRGVVALLDRRATARGYGEKVLSGLPEEVRRVTDFDEVVRFYQER
jgi:ATP-dependent DNA helicase DinG